MADITRRALFGKLDSIGYRSAESAAVYCKLRGNPYIELVHWLHQILQLPDRSDLRIAIEASNLDPARLASDITIALDRLPRGATTITSFSPHVDDAIKQGWMYATLLYGESQIRTGHVLIALLKTEHLRNILTGMSAEFAKIDVERLSGSFREIFAKSVEEGMTASDRSGLSADSTVADASAMPPPEMGKGEALKRYSVDLTERVRRGELDPIIGRDDEIRQIVDVLMRRRQNNPILTGEAGVGKTAVVEGFAQRVVAGDVPPALRAIAIHALDLGLLQAGASMKGEFENRLRMVIDEVQSSAKPIILFIDEAHMLIGAGGAAGQGDAANLLKPALARGTLRTIAATTWAEYKKYFEKDPALTRRFQVIKVDEPSEEKTVLMLRRSVSYLEKHHGVKVLEEAIRSAVKLSSRYIPARQLPDKAVSLLDTASARVAVSLHAVPAEVDDCRRAIENLEDELAILDRESAVGVDHADRREKARARLESERKRLSTLEGRWEKEKGLIRSILEIRQKLEAASKPAIAPVAKAGAPAAAEEAPRPMPEEERAALLRNMEGLQAELASVQGEHPLVSPWVDGQAIASVVADWTGIPVGRMVRNEIESVLKLTETLERRVIGQRQALEAITNRICTTRANLDNPDRPVGVFLLTGPSGVGKTETALALAEALYGGESNLITINMSEFQEKHTVSTLKGAPPGYVGYGEGGVLTEAVRRRPYSIVLLDEVEKAHPDVHEIFFQVFDKGWMEDGEGRAIDFKNTVILLTSNVGSDLILNLCKDPALRPDAKGLEKALQAPLQRKFPAAFLNRLAVVPFYPIGEDVLRDIVRLQLGRIQARLRENYGVPFEYDDDLVRTIAGQCNQAEKGARMVDAILTHTLLPDISKEFLARMLEGRKVVRVRVGARDGKFATTIE